MIPGDVRHAWRSIVRMPVLAAVVDRVARRRHRREHRRVLLGPGDGAPAAARRRRRRPHSSRRAARRDRVVSGRVVARISATCASGCTSLPDLFAFRMVPFNVGERGPRRADVRPARVRQLFLGARPDAGARPLPAAGRSGAAGGAAGGRSSRTTTGRRASAARRTSLGRTLRVNERRSRSSASRPRGFQGTVTDADVRSVGAGDDGAGAARRIARAGGSQHARLLRRRAARAARDARAGADRARRRDARSWRTTIRRPTRTMQAEVLPFWQAPRGPQRMLGTRAADPAGHHAAAAARGLRQHREPDAGARQRAPARDRRAPGARRRTVARRQPAADRKPAAGAARRGARRGDRGRGRTDAMRAVPMHRRVSDQVPDRASTRSALAFALALGVAVRPDLRRWRRRCSSRASIRRSRCAPGARTRRPQPHAQRADGGRGRRSRSSC